MRRILTAAALIALFSITACTSGPTAPHERPYTPTGSVAPSELPAPPAPEAAGDTTGLSGEGILPGGGGKK